MAQLKTTIQVSDATLQVLKSLRRQLDKSSYDKVLQEILSSRLDTPKSLAGAFPNLKWSKNDRMKFRRE